MPKKNRPDQEPLTLGVEIALGGSAITAERAKELLRWETEGQHNKKEEAFTYDLKDENDEKVKCWNNSKNRPLKEAWIRKLMQDILNRNWAGPLTMPGETINGESIVIGRSGQVISGQHRLIALVLAAQAWAGKDREHWQLFWKTEPVLETILVTGVSESPAVLRTLDNVMPRSEADVFYTSDLFSKLEPQERKECSRMLAKAVDFLWKRTGAGVREFNKYQTHTESVSFVSRHAKILECVKVIFDLNDERSLSVLKLSPGQCSGMMYLMASSNSDSDLYRKSDEPGDSSLTWDRWEQSTDFWGEISKGRQGKLKVVCSELASLVDLDTGSSGRQIEKHAVIAKAWGMFADGREIKENDVALQFEVDEFGAKRLIESPRFGGIDMGEGAKAEEGAPLGEDEIEEIEERKKEARRKKEEQALAEMSKAEVKVKAEQTLAEQLDELKTSNPGRVLFFKAANHFQVWGDDAKIVSRVFKKQIISSKELPVVKVKLPLKDIADKMLEAGYKTAICELDGKETKVTASEDYEEAIV